MTLSQRHPPLGNHLFYVIVYDRAFGAGSQDGERTVTCRERRLTCLRSCYITQAPTPCRSTRPDISAMVSNRVRSKLIAEKSIPNSSRNIIVSIASRESSRPAVNSLSSSSNGAKSPRIRSRCIMKSRTCERAFKATCLLPKGRTESWRVGRSNEPDPAERRKHAKHRRKKSPKDRAIRVRIANPGSA